MDLERAKDMRKGILKHTEDEEQPFEFTTMRLTRQTWLTADGTRRGYHARMAMFLGQRRQLRISYIDLAEAIMKGKTRVQRQQDMIDEGLTEDQRQRREHREKMLADELFVLNDIKRGRVIGHKLKAPLSMTNFKAVQHAIDERPATLSDLSRIRALRPPATKLSLMLKLPVLWNADMLPKRESLLDHIFRLFRHNIGPTVKVVVEGKDFYCHSMVLGFVCKLFANRKPGEVLYLPPCRIQERTFVTIYRWMFEPINLITLVHLLELLLSGEFLELKQLTRQCWRMIKDLLKSTDRIIAIYVLSRNINHAIENLIVPAVGYAWMSYATSTDFCEMSITRLRRLLEQDNLAVNSEMEVLYTLFIWLNYRWPQRKNHVLDMLKHIRFDMMPFIFVMTFIQRKDGPPAMEFLTDSLTAQNMVRGYFLPLCTKRNRNVGGDGERPRRWIYDPACHYHHSKQCKKARFVSYADFTKYMRWMQRVEYPTTNRIKKYDDKSIKCCKN